MTVTRTRWKNLIKAARLCPKQIEYPKNRRMYSMDYLLEAIRNSAPRPKWGKMRIVHPSLE